MTRSAQGNYLRSNRDRHYWIDEVVGQGSQDWVIRELEAWFASRDPNATVYVLADYSAEHRQWLSNGYEMIDYRSADKVATDDPDTR